LKSEGWTSISKKMKELFGIVFDWTQLKNQKGTMQKVYINMKFLIEQYGFGWNAATYMVTADEETWKELCDVCIPCLTCLLLPWTDGLFYK
jgi:hypothetical protein